MKRKMIAIVMATAICSNCVTAVASAQNLNVNEIQKSEMTPPHMDQKRFALKASIL